MCILFYVLAASFFDLILIRLIDIALWNIQLEHDVKNKFDIMNLIACNFHHVSLLREMMRVDKLHKFYKNMLKIIRCNQVFCFFLKK